MLLNPGTTDRLELVFGTIFIKYGQGLSGSRVVKCTLLAHFFQYNILSPTVTCRVLHIHRPFGLALQGDRIGGSRHYLQLLWFVLQFQDLG